MREKLQLASFFSHSNESALKICAGSLRTTFRLLAIPVLELVILRFFLKHVLELRIGWKLVTDYDFFLPVPVACWVAVLALENAGKIRFRFSRVAAASNLLMVGTFVLVCVFQASLVKQSDTLFDVLWLASLLAVVGTALLTVLDVRSIWENPAGWVLLPATCIAFSTVYSEYLLERFWPLLSYSAGKASFWAVSWLDGARLLFNEFRGNRVVLKSAYFAVSIGRKCGGMDGFLLFWQLGLMAIVLFHERMSLFRWPLFFLVGTAFMFVLNVLRIAGLFLLGDIFSRQFRYDLPTDLVLLLFHAHVGWLLYLPGLAGFFWVFLRSAKHSTVARENILERAT